MTTDEILAYILSWGTWDIVLTSVLAVITVYELYYIIRYLGGVARYARKQRRETPSAESEAEGVRTGEAQSLPGVTVVISARNEGYNLEHYLQAVLTQDYPVFEVFVVDDGSQDDTSDVIERYKGEYPNIRTTFVPKGARVSSTKKLALTMAAKSAKYDYLLLTDADCCPESDQWIRSMMSGFDQDTTEVVLGYGGCFYTKGKINRLSRYDTVYTGLLYLGAAIAGKPYMGVGRNLAYKKSTFFSHGGFAGMAHQLAGDDDLFVNKVATRNNTAVVLNRESVTWSPSKLTWHDWVQQKRRHLSVSPAYRWQTKLWLTTEPVVRALFYTAIILTAVFGHPVSWAVALLLYILRGSVLASTVNKGAKTLGERGFAVLRLWWYDISMPLLTLMLMSSQRKKRDLTW